MPNHPTKYIFKEMTKQILKKIFEDFDENKINEINDDFILSPIRIPYSNYDLKYHNFNYNIIPDDESIKNVIKMIFNNLEYGKCY